MASIYLWKFKAMAQKIILRNKLHEIRHVEGQDQTEFFETEREDIEELFKYIQNPIQPFLKNHKGINTIEYAQFLVMSSELFLNIPSYMK